MIQELSLKANKAVVPKVEVVACDAMVEDWRSRNWRNFAYSSWGMDIVGVADGDNVGGLEDAVIVWFSAVTPAHSGLPNLS